MSAYNNTEKAIFGHKDDDEYADDGADDKQNLADLMGLGTPPPPWTIAISAGRCAAFWTAMNAGHACHA